MLEQAIDLTRRLVRAGLSLPEITIDLYFWLALQSIDISGFEVLVGCKLDVFVSAQAMFVSMYEGFNR